MSALQDEVGSWFELRALSTLTPDSAAAALVLQRDGVPARGQAPLVRVLGRCKAVDGCWEYQGFRTRQGYGRARYVDGSKMAHRIVFAELNGPIPAGMFVCHHCDNPPCCNPDHLFLGTALDNNRDRQRKGRTRGLTPGNGNELRTHCLRGHAFTEANTRIDKRGARRCRTCERLRNSTRVRTRPPSPPTPGVEAGDTTGGAR